MPELLNAIPTATFTNKPQKGALFGSLEATEVIELDVEAAKTAELDREGILNIARKLLPHWLASNCREDLPAVLAHEHLSDINCVKLFAYAGTSPSWGDKNAPLIKVEKENIKWGFFARLFGTKNPDVLWDQADYKLFLELRRKKLRPSIRPFVFVTNGMVSEPEAYICVRRPRKGD